MQNDLKTGLLVLVEPNVEVLLYFVLLNDDILFEELLKVFRRKILLSILEISISIFFGCMAFLGALKIYIFYSVIVNRLILWDRKK